MDNLPKNVRLGGHAQGVHRVHHAGPAADDSGRGSPRFDKPCNRGQNHGHIAHVKAAKSQAGLTEARVRVSMKEKEKTECA